MLPKNFDSLLRENLFIQLCFREIKVYSEEYWIIYKLAQKR